MLGIGKRRVAELAGRTLLGLWALPLLGPVVQGGQIETLEVSQDGDHYAMAMKATVAAPRQAVYALLTDYARLAELAPAIQECRLLEEVPGEYQRVYTQAKQCVLFFCREVVHVQDVRQGADFTLTATTLPQYSDFRAGFARWVLDESDGGLTDLTFTLEITPDFWVPPLIGPALVKNMLRDEAVRTVEQLEHLYQASTNGELDKSNSPAGANP